MVKKIFTVLIIGTVTIGVIYGGIKMTAKKVAIIDVKGTIDIDNEFMEKIDKVRKDKKIGAVLLRVDSGGGTAFGGNQYYETIKKLQEEKPVYTYVTGLAASAAYMTILPSNHIMSSQIAMVGSVGVFSASINIQGFLKKLGVKVDLEKSSPLKAAPNLFEEGTEEAKQLRKDSVKTMMDYFRDVVEKNRTIPKEFKEEVFKAIVYIGSDALEVGLIDSVGSIYDIKELIEKETGLSKFKVIKKPKQGGLIKKLIFGAKADLGI